MATEGKRPRIDWEAVELDYRAGVKTLRVMAAEHGCAESAIRKKAKQEGWDRDLSAKVRQKADELVRKEEVRKAVREDPAHQATEREKVEVLAEVQANIIIGQRQDIRKSRRLVMALLDELEQHTDNRDLLDQLGVMMFQPDKNGQDKLYDIYQKVISLPGRTDVMKKLADSLKVLIGLEREAFGLGDTGEGSGNGKPIEMKVDLALPPDQAYLKLIGKA